MDRDNKAAFWMMSCLREEILVWRGGEGLDDAICREDGRTIAARTCLRDEDGGRGVKAVR